jgi:hypothetical protein
MQQQLEQLMVVAVNSMLAALERQQLERSSSMAALPYMLDQVRSSSSSSSSSWPRPPMGLSKGMLEQQFDSSSGSSSSRAALQFMLVQV